MELSKHASLARKMALASSPALPNGLSKNGGTRIGRDINKEKSEYYFTNKMDSSAAEARVFETPAIGKKVAVRNVQQAIRPFEDEVEEVAAEPESTRQQLAETLEYIKSTLSARTQNPLQTKPSDFNLKSNSPVAPTREDNSDLMDSVVKAQSLLNQLEGYDAVHKADDRNPNQRDNVYRRLFSDINSSTNEMEFGTDVHNGIAPQKKRRRTDDSAIHSNLGGFEGSDKWSTNRGETEDNIGNDEPEGNVEKVRCSEFEDDIEEVDISEVRGKRVEEEVEEIEDDVEYFSQPLHCETSLRKKPVDSVQPAKRRKEFCDIFSASSETLLNANGASVSHFEQEVWDAIKEDEMGKILNQPFEECDFALDFVPDSAGEASSGVEVIDLTVDTLASSISGEERNKKLTITPEGATDNVSILGIIATRTSQAPSIHSAKQIIEMKVSEVEVLDLMEVADGALIGLLPFAVARVLSEKKVDDWKKEITQRGVKLDFYNPQLGSKNSILMIESWQFLIAHPSLVTHFKSPELNTVKHCLATLDLVVQARKNNRTPFWFGSYFDENNKAKIDTNPPSKLRGWTYVRFGTAMLPLLGYVKDGNNEFLDSNINKWCLETKRIEDEHNSSNYMLPVECNTGKKGKGASGINRGNGPKIQVGRPINAYFMKKGN